MTIIITSSFSISAICSYIKEIKHLLSQTSDWCWYLPEVLIINVKGNILTFIEIHFLYSYESGCSSTLSNGGTKGKDICLKGHKVISPKRRNTTTTFKFKLWTHPGFCRTSSRSRFSSVVTELDLEVVYIGSQILFSVECHNRSKGFKLSL